ncbi:protein DBF4 homolog A isoform X2 [Hippocampus comes]|uniref:protein DBF4 homolog A isoform X2 n=1 Tax=Hippocampus comes TaxID=109280 RepID=UPI00094ECA59|nr:PREDICTED: protein DBF4 homolog A isoform X2 [Hippocampus comes]
MWTYRGRTRASCSAKENKMKAQDTHTQTGADWKGKAGKSGEKKSPVKSRLVQFKPLSGKVFYLDLPSNKTAESLERDIKNLGGSVDKFFSKDIKYLVSNKRETKYMQCLRQDSRPGLQSGQISLCSSSYPPQPDCGSDNTKNRSQGQAETFRIRHRRSFVEKAAKEKDILQTSKILSKALEWGVKIFYVDDVLVYIEMKKKTVASQCPNLTAAKPPAKDASIAEFPCQKSKGRIRKPFIKVEDSSRHYRPIYVTMTSMPELNLKTLAPHCPFLVDAKKPAGAKRRENSAKVSACEGQAAGRKNNNGKNGDGYCECCMAKYGNLMTHLRSERHQAFSKSDAYKVLNQVVSPLDCTRFNTFMKSASSVQLDTGPFGGLSVRATENIEEKHQPDNCPKEPFTFQVTSSPQSAPLLHREDKTCWTDSHRSKQRSILRKRPCRLNLFTSSPQKAAEETAPSCGESMALGPLLIPHVNFDVQVPYAGTQSHQEPRCESYLGSPSVVTNQREETDRSKKPPGKVSGNISERDGDHLFSQSCFPTGTVQRKVRVYERQRWKMDAMRQEHVTQNGTRDKSPNALANFSIH